MKRQDVLEVLKKYEGKLTPELMKDLQVDFEPKHEGRGAKYFKTVPAISTDGAYILKDGILKYAPFVVNGKVFTPYFRKAEAEATAEATAEPAAAEATAEPAAAEATAEPAAAEATAKKKRR